MTYSIRQIAILVFLVLYAIQPGICQEKKTYTDIFEEVDRIYLNFDNLPFARLENIVAVSDGYVVSINESAYGNMHMLVKLDKKGNIKKKYTERGNGPGGLRSPLNITVFPDFFLVSERQSPFVHKFSQDLEFVKDYRIKKSGIPYNLDKYIGIWQTYNSGTRIYTLALYEKENFTFVKYAFEIKEVPSFVHLWGGIEKNGKSGYICIYPTRHELILLNEDFTLDKTLPIKPSNHFVNYTPWKGSPSHVDSRVDQWLHSWSKLEKIYKLNDIIMLKHLLKKKRYLEFVDQKGNLLLSNVEEDKFASVLFVKDTFVFILHWNKDESKHWISRNRLTLN